MNPSVVPHPDQSGLERGTTRIVMSLRAVGEGHISSIAFREGVVSPSRGLELMPEPPFATAATRQSKTIDARRAGHGAAATKATCRAPSSSRSPRPSANGLEDLRLAYFTHDDGRKEWIGTYTAFSGGGIRCEMIRTKDFSASNWCR